MKVKRNNMLRITCHADAGSLKSLIKKVIKEEKS